MKMTCHGGRGLLLCILFSVHGRTKKVKVPKNEELTSQSAALPLIPKIIHHSSIHRHPIQQADPPTYITLVSWNSWRKFYPSPEYQVFVGTDAVMDKCIEEEFPDFKSQWDILQGVEKADAGRYCMLYKHGGIYADLDYEARTNFLEELNRHGDNVHLVEACFPETVPDQDGPVSSTFQNSMMASPPRHPFWRFLFESMKMGGPHHAWNDQHGTGPRMLTLAAAQHNSTVRPLPCANFQRFGKCGNFMELGPQKGIHWNQASWIKGFTPNQAVIHKGFPNAHPELGDVGEKPVQPEDVAKALDQQNLALALTGVESRDLVSAFFSVRHQ